LQGTGLEQPFVLLLAKAPSPANARAICFDRDRSGATAAGMFRALLGLVLPAGERLRIGAGVNAAVLRTVLEALRK